MGKLKDIFKKNGYPNGIFDRCLNKFLDRKFNEKRGERVEDETEYVVLVAPYFGHVSDNLKKKMCKIGKDLNVKTRVVFKSFKIGQYFSLKDVTPKEIKANVIYKFTGSCDKSITYIGKTIRHLAIRSKGASTPSNIASKIAGNCVADPSTLSKLPATRSKIAGNTGIHT